MSLFNRIFGPRWSLRILKGNTPAYAMHENSVIRLVGYMMPYYSKGRCPLSPWIIYLTFNKRNKSIILEPEHFAPDGRDLSSALIAEIRRIDPDYMVKGNEPEFEELPSGKKLPIANFRSNDLSSFMESISATMGRPRS